MGSETSHRKDEGTGQADSVRPNPGSDEAIRQGCVCAILDNAHGRGYMGQPGTFVYTQGCPVHDEQDRFIADLSAVLKRMNGVFKPGAVRWLYTENQMLEGQKPIALVEGGKTENVLALLDALAEGVIM